ncbi:MAG: aminopeptidase N [Pseudomonadota bacterium]
MRTETPPAVNLADYAPYPFAIENATLHFDLDPDKTEVEAVLRVKRVGDGSDPLVLDGEGLALKSIAIDNRPLDEGEYETDEATLTIADVPDAFTLRTVVEIAPSKNTALSGLYMSGGRFCTQCEAEGFRRITYWPDRPDVMSRFEVRVVADKVAYPYLLSNGSPGQSGDLSGGRHFAEWTDPHPKPSYLFALCAGDYDVFEDRFTTASGRDVGLAIHVDKGDAPRAAWAMDCLKRSMRWDEEVFGREYDLDVFNIVAVRDFNFGAMENKGLNVFNSAYVLADEDTANDQDFEAIESIVAHEYFHNWTGNRITCRDWFQLCLKEGLTVFRDQEFSADQRSRPVQRIKDVIRLRARQFAEDAGPLAHPVRPDNYGSIDNLYTATVYEKGAELIRVLKRHIGDEAFAAGMAEYFERFDGTAATIEDFYSCFESASGRDLAAFRVWYAQAGTPEVSLEEDWDSAAGRLTLRLSQTTAPTPGQDDKAPVVIPLACALLDGEGGHVAADGWPGGERLVVLDADRMELSVEFGAGAARPMVSINRGFTAPVTLKRALDREGRLALAAAETDPFNRWDAFQSLGSDEILRLAAADAQPDAVFVNALAGAVEAAAEDDPAYAALLLRLADVGELFLRQDPADAAGLDAARKSVRRALGERLQAFFADLLAQSAPAPFKPDEEQAGVRALRGAAMSLLATLGDGEAGRLRALYEAASDMTEQLSALRALCDIPGEDRDAALAAFYKQWRDNPLVIDKWFGAQAARVDADGVRALMAHPDFDLSNPNRVRSVAAVFSMQNLAAFHAPDGSGHKLLADLAKRMDPINPALAGRLLTAFEQWRRLEPQARATAATALKALAEEKLSKNAADIVSRSLS